MEKDRENHGIEVVVVGVMRGFTVHFSILTLGSLITRVIVTSARSTVYKRELERDSQIDK